MDISIHLHDLFHKLKRYKYPFDIHINNIPQNGIYIKFEEGESFDSFDRVVRIGTDTGENQLHSRLFQHYSNENQRRSIFRKNIGRSILNKNNNPYLKYWDLDITSRVDKEMNYNLIDFEFEKLLEKEISNYIQTNISFCVINVEKKEQRLFWESKLISTLAYPNLYKPSSNWLGNHSPKKQIKLSGLWQVQGLNGPKLSDNDFEDFKKLMRQNLIV